MAIKKKVVKKETAKPSKKVSKKATPKPIKKKVAPRGTPVKKSKLSTLFIQVIENLTKGVGASINVGIEGDMTSLLAGIIATMNQKPDFNKFIERIAIAYLNEYEKKSNKKK